MAKGYKIYSKDNYNVLLIKLECLDSCYKDAFKKFLGCSDFTLYNSNEAKDKPYNWIYTEFKSRLKLPEKYIEMMRSSKYVRHFYSSKEIELTYNAF